MLPYFWYILKVIICSGILFGYYWLFLRNKVFHQYNRFYLLAALALSLLLPLLKIDFWQQDGSQVIKVLQVVSASDDYMNNVIITANKDNWSVQQLYPIVYWMVSFIFLLLLLQTLFVIRSLLKKYPVQIIDKFSFVNTDYRSTPFSFLKYIFWNTNIDMDTVTGKQIFKHEVAHIQEKHTYDKLFVNIILIFFWCNPFFWLYRKELNMIHEFIADKKAVEDSDTATFAAMILQAAYPQHRFQLTSNFFYSPLKRRLLMLTKNNNPKVNYFARVMVLPLALLIFAAFTFKTKTANKSGLVPQKKYTGIPTSDTTPVVTYINTKHAGAQYLKTDEYKKKALVIVDSKEIGNVGLNYIEKANTQFSSIVIYNPTEAGKIYGEKGRFGAIKLTQKDAISITADSVFYDEKNQSIKLSGTNTTLAGDLANTLIYVDQKIVSPVELNAIQPSNISSISILKGEKIDEIVEAKGKTAVIYVTLKPADLDEVVVTGVLHKTETPAVVVEGTLLKETVLATNTNPKLYFGDVTGSRSEVEFFKKQKEIRVSGGYKFLSALVYFTTKGHTDVVVLDGNSLSSIRGYLDRCESGSVVTFDNIRVIDANGQVRGLEGISFGLYSADVNTSKFGTQVERPALITETPAKLDYANNQEQRRVIEANIEKAIVAPTEFRPQQDNKVFTKTEVSPEFTGGQEAWRKYLERNLKASIPVDEGWGAGKYTVIVKFIVHTDGTVSDVTSENYKGTKTALESIRVIKDSPKWQPAIQNGHKVNAYKKQPITFLIEEQ